MTAVAFAIYAACVDFLLKLAALLGVTYRDANALLFFVLWPIVTLALALWVVVQAVRLRLYARRDTSDETERARARLLANQPAPHRRVAASRGRPPSPLDSF